MEMFSNYLRIEENLIKYVLNKRFYENKIEFNLI